MKRNLRNEYSFPSTIYKKKPYKIIKLTATDAINYLFYNCHKLTRVFHILVGLNFNVLFTLKHDKLKLL